MTLIDDQPWFVAKDVCVILGLMKSAGTSPALRSLDISERRREDRISLLSKQVAVGSLFGKDEPSLNLISESGLYKLVMRSDKPQAKEFQNWITKVVLPAIRKDGGYVLGEEKLGQFKLGDRLGDPLGDHTQLSH